MSVAPASGNLNNGSAVCSPSTQVNREDYKLLLSMASHRDKWSSSRSIAHEFMSKLETALRQSPVPIIHWIYLIPLMISEHDRNMQDWVEERITSPNLSWNAAKALFIKHYEHADWKDSLRIKYDACIQQADELVQTYTDRLAALMRHLNISDGDILNIDHYMNGLHSVVYSKLLSHRSDMRNLPLAGSIGPAWNYTSFIYVSSKASSFENELSAARRTHAQPSAASHVNNNDNDNDNNDDAGDIDTDDDSITRNKRKSFDHNINDDTPSPHKKLRGQLDCMWHPNATSHSTDDCRNPGIESDPEEPSIESSPSTPPAVTTTIKKDLSHIECYGCHETGHYKSNCPDTRYRI